MLTMESLYKFMEDVLETKDSNFIVDYLYLIHSKARIKQYKDRIYRKAQLLNMEVNKVGII